MEPIRMIDIAYVLDTLNKISKPSKRVQAAIDKCEDKLCSWIEEM